MNHDRRDHAGAMVAATPEQMAPSAPPRVLQVLPSLRRGGGGVERSAIDVARALADAGGRPLVASAGGEMVHELTRAGVDHAALPLASKNPVTIYRNAGRLSKLIARHAVDIVHARSRAPAWSALLASARTGARFVTTFHGTYTHGGALKHRYNAVMTRGDRIIANSHFIARHIAEHYRADPAIVRVIPRGIDTARFSADRVSAERIVHLARSWRLPDGLPVVMLPGRMARWKGQALLIEALARLGRRDVTCVIVGAARRSDWFRSELVAQCRRQGVADIVYLHDHCDDMPAAYMLADVVVSASIEPEAFGRVVAEAQAMGRPVVVARHGGAPEQIIDGHTGWAFAPGDPDGLARGLALALDLDQSARERMSAAAAAHAREHFAVETMCAATLAVYEELMVERT